MFLKEATIELIKNCESRREIEKLETPEAMVGYSVCKKWGAPCIRVIHSGRCDAINNAVRKIDKGGNNDANTRS